MILETARLYLREMNASDYDSLCKILQDDDVMYAYEGALTEEETQNWLHKQTARYQKDGVGLWAVILKESGEMIGQCGLTIQDWKDGQVLEIGYLFQKVFWHKGYAIEAASACREYAFDERGAQEVFAIIRNTNTASQKVAKRMGMEITDVSVRHYCGVAMPHFLFSVKRVPLSE